MHCVFATKERRPLIKPALQERLWPYLGGIARENKMKALVVGGVEDHVHVLLSVPSTLSVAKSLQLLKGNSSRWIHDTFKEHWDFEWQEGYGAFSIGVHDGLQCNAPDVPPAGPYGDDLKDAICPEWVPTCYQRGHLEGCTAARDCSCP